MAKKEAEEKVRVGKKSAGDWAVDIFITIIFGLFTIVCIFPFYYIFINTISNNNLVMTGKISLFPQGIHFQNYVRVLTLKELPPALFVSIARTVLGTIFTVFAASFPAYAFTRNEYWGRKFFYRFVVVTMYFSAGLILSLIHI